MKKTVSKEEYFCDFCGGECTEKHYDIVLPEKQRMECKKGKAVDKTIIYKKIYALDALKN